LPLDLTVTNRGFGDSSVELIALLGWYAISVHKLYNRTEIFAHLLRFETRVVVDYSIQKYHLTEHDFVDWRELSNGNGGLNKSN
jgi:hypothetical protein